MALEYQLKGYPGYDDYLVQVVNSKGPRDTGLDRLSLRQIGKFMSGWKPSTTRIFSMEAPHGSPTHRASFFLSCRCSRSSQSSWPTASPVGHSRVSVLCPHVCLE